MDLRTPLSSAENRNLKNYAIRLRKLNLFTLQDLLYHIPSRYEDYSLLSLIGQVQEGEIVTLKGKLLEAKNEYTRHGKTIQKVIISDESGTMQLTWFNQPYLIKSFKTSNFISVAGKIEKFGNQKTMLSPNYEQINELSTPTLHTGRLVAIYPETAGISSKWLRRQIFQILNKKDVWKDFLPQEIKERNNFNDLLTTLKNVHFPSTLEDAFNARKRLEFEELFFLQLNALSRRKIWRESSQKSSAQIKMEIKKEKIDKLISTISFELTTSQKNVITTIFEDLNKSTSMNRLLQGDVGSGKTIVAAIIMYHVFLNGFQSTLLAPTSILAEQHFRSISSLLNPLGVRIGIATGNKKNKNKSNEFDILIGTHALLTQSQEFKKLALVIIDEQQRFGVRQRSILKAKGSHPHLLT